MNLVKPLKQGQMEGPLSGYYYYYFPIKNLLTKTNDTATTSSSVTASSSSSSSSSHMPQEVEESVTTTIDPSNNAVEPLFVAVTSFIGLALVFLFSIVLVPRFHNIKLLIFHLNEIIFGLKNGLIIMRINLFPFQTLQC